jgi:hypothetical protein
VPLPVLAALVAAVHIPAVSPPAPITKVISYTAPDSARRTAVLLPRGYRARALPLVISPHGRGVGPEANARLWGDLPQIGGFAVVNPEGEGRRLGLFSWGARGQIDDLARIPAIVAHAGVRIDRHRIYAVGGSMGGQETLLLVARHPRLLAGAAVFDLATDMARRYWDFARLPGGEQLQALAREEVGGTPLTNPGGYAERSPDSYARRIADSGVPIQLYWSTRDRVIADQRDESRVLLRRIFRWNPFAYVISFHGEWQHDAEMRPYARLPRALVRLGLLPWSMMAERPGPDGIRLERPRRA